MITRRKSLTEALDEVEGGVLKGVSTLVVSRQWWQGLAMKERLAFRARAGRVGLELREDTAMSGHFVELRDGNGGPPLSTERPT